MFFLKGNRGVIDRNRYRVVFVVVEMVFLLRVRFWRGRGGGGYIRRILYRVDDIFLEEGLDFKCLGWLVRRVLFWVDF